MTAEQMAQVLATQKNQPAFDAVIGSMAWQYRQHCMDLVVIDSAKIEAAVGSPEHKSLARKSEAKSATIEFLAAVFDGLRERVPGIDFTPLPPPQKAVFNKDNVEVVQAPEEGQQ